MMTTNGALPKLCPKCKGKDVTDFSSCRFCGTRYDANPATFERKSVNLDQSAIGLVALIGLGIAGYFWLTTTMQHDAAEKMKPIAEKIQASHRPRVIEFYANWCGPCRAYGPIIEACERKYSDRVDFQRLNVDDPNSRELAQMLQVRSIPRTCIFDKDGKPVASFTGGASAATLDGYMAKVLPN